MSTVTAGRAASAVKSKGHLARRLFEWGGIAAGVVLIAFGIGALVMGIQGRSTVNDSLSKEKIVGSADMTPSAIKTEAAQAGLTNVDLPTCNVANQPINDGSSARCFAQYMRVHALESTGGLTYAQMGRFATADGKPAGTNDENAAVKDANGQPVANAARNVWVTETALTTALNTSYMASQVGLFSIIVGIALLLSGVGFVILAVGGALRHRAVEARQAEQQQG